MNKYGDYFHPNAYYKYGKNIHHNDIHHNDDGVSETIFDTEFEYIEVEKKTPWLCFVYFFDAVFCCRR